MIASMGCIALMLPVLIALPLVLGLVFFNVVTLSLEKLGLSPEAAVALLVATLIGSLINIPISRHRIEYEEPHPTYSGFLYYLPPKTREQVVAINVGGAIIPVGVSIYLIPMAPLWQTVVATAVVAVVAKFLARPVPGVGIVMPGWVPPLISAALALLLARENPAPVAFVAGTLGTLVGADLLNWRSFKKLGSQTVSIGGAGVFDGIFLSGIVASLLT